MQLKMRVLAKKQKIMKKSIELCNIILYTYHIKNNCIQ